MSKPVLVPIWLYAWSYQTWSKFIHKHGYHHAPSQPPIDEQTLVGLGNSVITQQRHWCQWCGMRGNSTALTEVTKDGVR